MAHLALHQHGKSRVRLGRVWRKGSEHYFVEWTVFTTLESDMEHAFLTSSNAGMTATDTQKNAVYYVAKQMANAPCSPEEYAIALAKHFLSNYPLVSKAKILVNAAPWKKVSSNGIPHEHAYVLEGTEVRTAAAHVDRSGTVEVTAGFQDMRVLKTTQSGYAGFLHDKFTTLPDVSDRIVATAVTANWRYSTLPNDYDAAYGAVKDAMLLAFFGPPRGGVYSPSVQFTLFQMAKAAIERVPQISSVFLNMPNLHFLPCTPVDSKFEDDVYIATSEPHGNIEAVVTRGMVQPHCKL